MTFQSIFFVSGTDSIITHVCPWFSSEPGICMRVKFQCQMSERKGLHKITSNVRISRILNAEDRMEHLKIVGQGLGLCYIFFELVSKIFNYIFFVERLQFLLMGILVSILTKRLHIHHD